MNIIARSALTLLLLVPTLTFGQPITDITLVNTGTGELEVRVRPAGDFDGFFAASVFTIRWLDASGVDLGGVVTQTPPAVHYVSESGDMAIEGIYRYQIYAGFGNVPISSTGGNWIGGQEVVLCTIAVPLDGTVYAIVEDDWTEANNGDYFISFNGVAVGGGTTGGVIYSVSTSVHSLDNGSVVKIVPNPTNGPAWIELSGMATNRLELTLIDATGRSIWNKFYSVTEGNSRLPLDFSGSAEGAYTLSVRSDKEVTFHRLVVAR